MKDERKGVPDSSNDLVTSARVDQEEVVQTPENSPGNFSRRGFLGRAVATLAAVGAGIWAWPKSANAQQRFQCPPQSACIGPPPPPPIIDYTTETTNLMNNMFANFNAHNAQAVVNVFDSAVVNAPQMLSSMGHAFTAFPNLTLTITSMSVTALGRSVTINYSLTGTHEVTVADALVVINGSTKTYAENVVSPDVVTATGASDTATGTNTFGVLNGSLITSVTGSGNLADVFAAHGAEIVVA